jgi:hypothetical protein
VAGWKTDSNNLSRFKNGGVITGKTGNKYFLNPFLRFCRVEEWGFAIRSPNKQETEKDCSTEKF